MSITSLAARVRRTVSDRVRLVREGVDPGMTTAEYAVGTVAPVGRLIRSQGPVFTGLHCVLLRVGAAVVAA